MESMELFSILDSVDSTNNYAMAKIHEGVARHGMAWFARDQFAGKGQRGKEWISIPGQNIAMSIIIKPAPVYTPKPFVFNAIISNACIFFLARYINQELKIKWPNDIYLGDRKAGGILIENVYHGKTWKWAVAGIGININQESFSETLKNPVSLKQHTGIEYDPISLAKDLHCIILNSFSAALTPAEVMIDYNKHLYRLDQKAMLSTKHQSFETTITGVNMDGELLANNGKGQAFTFGEVEWIL